MKSIRKNQTQGINRPNGSLLTVIGDSSFNLLQTLLTWCSPSPCIRLMARISILHSVFYIFQHSQKKSVKVDFVNKMRKCYLYKQILSFVTKILWTNNLTNPTFRKYYKIRNNIVLDVQSSKKKKKHGCCELILRSTKNTFVIAQELHY